MDEIGSEHRAGRGDRAREADQQLAGDDMVAVGDLIRGKHRVLQKVPSPEPGSMPASRRRGSVGELDREGRIVSTYLGARYEVHYSGIDSAVFAPDEQPERQTKGPRGQEDEPRDG